MKLVTNVTRVFDRIIDFLALMAAILLIFLMVSITYEVVQRYLLNRATFWLPEITEYILLWITFLGAAWLLKREGHVKMDLLLNRLMPGTQTIFNLITSVMGIFICLVLTWYGAKVTWGYFQTGYYIGTMLMPPKAPIMLIIPIGSFLLFIQFLRRAYSCLGSWRAS